MKNNRFASFRILFKIMRTISTRTQIQQKCRGGVRNFSCDKLHKNVVIATLKQEDYMKSNRNLKNAEWDLFDQSSNVHSLADCLNPLQQEYE